MLFHRTNFSFSFGKTVKYIQTFQNSSKIQNNTIFIIDDNSSYTISNTNNWQSSQLQRSNKYHQLEIFTITKTHKKTSLCKTSLSCNEQPSICKTKLCT